MCKFFVLCPAYYETGGVELLHQLVYKINKIKENCAVIYYHNFDSKRTEHPTAEIYMKYTKGIYVTSVEDLSKNIIVIPEIFLNKIADFNLIKVVVWWLSVDNLFLNIKEINSKKKLHYKEYKAGKKYFLFRVLNIFGIKPDVAYNPFTKKTLYSKKVILHAYQSEYARIFLTKKNLLPQIQLSDFLNSTFFKETIMLAEKEDQILYNPKKGIGVTRVLISNFPEYRWIALENFTPLEMRDVMRKAKIYVDFGNHPGKDRIPREAAINGCIVITNKEGAAYNSIDISIDEKYKLNSPLQSKEEFKSLVDNIFLNFEKHFDEFQFYRDKIKIEEEIFEKELLEFYLKCLQ